MWWPTPSRSSAITEGPAEPKRSGRSSSLLARNLLATVNYAEALEVALGHGWIDGQKRRYDDETSWLQRFTPRGPRSKWSRINRDKAEALRSSPDDLAAALAADTSAKAFFDTLTGANRYAILFRVHDVKRPETRAARSAKFVQMRHNHQTVH